MATFQPTPPNPRTITEEHKRMSQLFCPSDIRLNETRRVQKKREKRIKIKKNKEKKKKNQRPQAPKEKR